MSIGSWRQASRAWANADLLYLPLTENLVRHGVLVRQRPMDQHRNISPNDAYQDCQEPAAFRQLHAYQTTLLQRGWDDFSLALADMPFWDWHHFVAVPLDDAPPLLPMLGIRTFIKTWRSFICKAFLLFPLLKRPATLF